MVFYDSYSAAEVVELCYALVWVRTTKHVCLLFTAYCIDALSYIINNLHYDVSVNHLSRASV